MNSLLRTLGVRVIVVIINGLMTNDDDIPPCKMCLTYWLETKYGGVVYNDTIKPRIRDKLHVSSYGIIDWNDAKERTFEEVYGLLKELDI